MKGLSPQDVMLTLSEALREAPVKSTLYWGRDFEHLDKEWLDHSSTQLFSHDLITLRTLGHAVHEQLLPTSGKRFERIVVRIPGTNEALDYILNGVQGSLTEDGEVWFVGHTREGIKSLPKKLETPFASPAVQHVKRRVRVLISRLQSDAASPHLKPQTFERTFSVSEGPIPLQAVTMPGVFAHGRLDAGTEHMLAAFQNKLKFRTALDLGCGSGVLGATLALLKPASTVKLVDRSLLAIHAAKRTCAINEVTNASVIPAVATDFRGKERFDLIVANPPFHKGRQTLQVSGEQFIKAAAKSLNPRGRFIMVANRHLAYTQALPEHFHRVSVLREDNAFRVWTASGPIGG